jgi:hypothetical protein
LKNDVASLEEEGDGEKEEIDVDQKDVASDRNLGN